MRMSGNKYSRAMGSIFANGAAFAVSYGISLVLTPYLTEYMGTEACGFVTLAKQLAQYAAIITMTLDSFAARHITIEYYRGCLKQANVFFSSVFFGDLLLASAILAVVTGCVFFLERLLNIPEAMAWDIKLLFLFVFVNFWITTAFTVFGTSLYIKNRLDIAGLFKGLSYLTEGLVLCIAYALFPTRVFFVGVGIAAAGVVVACSNIRLCRKYTPELSPKRKDFSGSAVKRLVMDGIWNSVNSLGDLLNSGLDLIVCNRMLSAVAMGQMAIAKTVYTIFISLLCVVEQAFQPMLLKSYARNDRESLVEELFFAMKVSGMLSNVGFAGFAALGMAYYRLWIPNQEIELIYWLTVISLLTIIPGGPMKPLYYIYTLTVKKRIPCFITIAGGVLNVAGMYVLIRFTGMGIYAVVWTTAAVMMAINLISNPLYMAHVLHLPWHTFYPGIIRNLLACSALTILFQAFARLYMPDNWLCLILCILLYAAAGCALHLAVVFGRRDWNRIKGLIKRRGARQND